MSYIFRANTTTLINKMDHSFYYYYYSFFMLGDISPVFIEIVRIPFFGCLCIPSRRDLALFLVDFIFIPRLLF